MKAETDTFNENPFFNRFVSQ